jgi:hypothetical protein
MLGDVFPYALRAARGPCSGSSSYDYDSEPEVLDMNVARYEIAELEKNARIIAHFEDIFSLRCVPVGHKFFQEIMIASSL